MRAATHRLTRLSTATLALCTALFLAPHGFGAGNTPLNSDETTFIKHEAAAGVAEVKLAELGAKKATHSDVKAFAQKLIDNHGKANAELAALAAAKGVELSAVINPEDAKIFQDLEEFSGSAFDKAYIDAVVSSHKMCVSEFETSSKNAKDAELKQWVDKMIPGLKAHLGEAKVLSSSLVVNKAGDADFLPTGSAEAQVPAPKPETR